MIVIFIIALLFTSPAWGAFTEVGSGTQAKSCSGYGDTTTCAFAGSVTSGSLLIVGGQAYSGATVTSCGVTDTVKTSYSVLSYPATASTNHMFLAYGLAPSGGANTITVDCDVDVYVSYGIDEFSGSDATPLNVNAGGANGIDSAPTHSITTTVADALIVGVAGDDSGNTSAITEGSGFTKIAEEENGSLYMRYGLEFKIATSATTYTVDWTTADSVSWQVLAASFKPFVAAGGGATRRRLNAQGIVIE